MLNFLITITFLSLVAGLIKPSWFNKIFKREMSRKLILLFLGVPFLFFAIISPSPEKNINPDPIKNENIAIDKSHKSQSTSTPEEIKQEVDQTGEIEDNNEPIISNLEKDNFDNIGKPPTPEENDNGLVYYQVDRVVDGDTVRVLIDGVSQSIRLIGIDTPETVHPTKAVECMGKEASDTAKRLLNGKKVALEEDQSQGDKDKYNRLIRYIILEDETNFNKWMILEGYAYEYTYNTPYKYQAEFKQAQATAQANKKGLWADGVCNNFETERQEEIQDTQPPVGTTSPTGQYDCSGNIYNCSSFTTHAEAQSAFDYCFTQVGTDIHKLDADNNGVACESLP